MMAQSSKQRVGWLTMQSRSDGKAAHKVHHELECGESLVEQNFLRQRVAVGRNLNQKSC